MTLSHRQVADLLAAHGIQPRRSLGQNFVADPNTVRRIARLAGVGAGDQVVEVGAGLGALTLVLAETGARVTAIEADDTLVPVLHEVLAEPMGRDVVRVVHGDALAADWADILGEHERWVLVANLPYNVATPLVLDLLDGVPAIRRMLIMVQREVAERLAAPAGTSAYGIPSVKVAYHATSSVVGRVPATVFMPRPRVESALVGIERRDRPATDADPAVLFALVRAAFGGRRKMLRRSLAGRVPPAAFERAAVDPEARPEQLDVVDWGRLADAVGTVNDGAS